MRAAKQLSNLQLELLKVFSFDLDEGQLIEIRDLLAKYFAEKATEEMDKLWEENHWDEGVIKEWSNEHMRST
ncbi:MAG: hypothetical protein GVY26_08435 [Bacteroidetes bacterium]|jgi:hypothetical protein|nr:hypothetical protein [Bacteroidota bacterium]